MDGLMVPNFFVVGGQKCGTTSLHTYLTAHPDIYLPKQKETKYFVDDALYAKGISSYEETWYSSHLNERAVGEVDPDYMYFEHALDRMRENIEIDKAKFIFIFREPVSRAFSHYLMTYRRGIEPLSFKEAINAEHKRIQQDYYSRMHYSYIDRGFYYRQVKRFLNYVDAEQILYILSEDLLYNTESTVNECFRFLGVNPDVEVNYEERQHKASMPRSVKFTRLITSSGIHKSLVKTLLPFPKLRRKLRRGLLEINQTDNITLGIEDSERERLKTIYQQENKKLSGLISRDLTHWDLT